MVKSWFLRCCLPCPKPVLVFCWGLTCSRLPTLLCLTPTRALWTWHLLPFSLSLWRLLFQRHACVANRILVSPLVSLRFFRLSLNLAVLQLYVCIQPSIFPFVLVWYPCSVSVSGFVLHWFHLVLLPVSKECLPRRCPLLCSLWTPCRHQACRLHLCPWPPKGLGCEAAHSHLTLCWRSSCYLEFPSMDYPAKGRSFHNWFSRLSLVYFFGSYSTTDTVS